jgi:hypothetical protein
MNKKSSSTVGAVSELNNFYCHKDTTEPLHFQNQKQQKLYELFLPRERYTIVQLSDLLRISDPRSHIRFLRNAGIPISDFWIRTPQIKYKVYFFAGGDQ